MQRDPKDVEAWTGLVRSLIVAGKLSSAEDIVQKGREATEDAPALMLEQARILSVRGKLGEATRLAREAAAREDALLGNRAAELARKRIEVLPRSLDQRTRIEAYTLIAELESQRGRWARAAIAYGKVLESDPNLLDTLIARGDAYAKLGKTVLAAEDYRAALAVRREEPGCARGPGPHDPSAGGPVVESPREDLGDIHLTYEVVEIPNRMRKWLLAGAIGLVVLLIAVFLAVALLTSPVGAPSQDDLAGIGWVRSIYGWGNLPTEQLKRPIDAVFASDGTVWVVDGQNDRLVRFGADNSPVQIVALKRGRAKGQVLGPQSVATSRQGDIYLTDAVRGVVIRLAPDGSFEREWRAPFAGDISIAGDRVAVTGKAGWTVFDLDGKKTGEFGTSRGRGLLQLDLPRGILLARDGTTYVADTGNARVKAYDSAGDLLWVSNAPHRDITENGSERVTGFTPLSRESSATQGADHLQVPVGLALDARGRLIVVDALDFSLYVLDPKDEGEFVAHYGTVGRSDGKFLYPTNISYDRDRDWFAVADTYNGRVQIVTLPRTGALPTAVLARADMRLWLCVIPLLVFGVAFFLLVRVRQLRDDDALIAVQEDVSDVR